MNHRQIGASLALLVLAGCGQPLALESAGASAAPGTPDIYTLSPIMADGALQAVSISLTFTGEADGETIVQLPTRFANQQDLWRHVSGFTVEGGTAAAVDDNTRAIAHCGGCKVTVRYQVDSAYDATPREYAKGGAVIWADRLGSYGEALFATVSGHEHHPARFVWRGWPSNWVRISDLDHGATGRAMSVGDIVESTLLASPKALRFDQTIDGQPLTIGVLGEYEFATAEFVDQVTKTIVAQRRFWGGTAGPFTVTLYPIQDAPGRSSLSGTGRSDAFVLESTSNLDLPTMTRLIAHEHNHTWIPRQIGEFPSDISEAELYWFSEGVTDFYTGRSLLAANIWSVEEFADDFNTMLQRLDASPERAEPNHAIGERFWDGGDIQQLPYDRGRLFAMLVDFELRQQSGGRTDYDDLVTIMRHRYNAAVTGAEPELRGNFVAAAGQLALAAEPLLERYIDRGEPIDLPGDAFAPCGPIATVTVAVFDPGFDRAASTAAGLIAGVDPQGPAYAAGLRDGMRRIAYVSSAEGNSRVPMLYRIADAAGERVLSWLPAGRDMITIREFQPGPLAASEACHRVLAGN